MGFGQKLGVFEQVVWLGAPDWRQLVSMGSGDWGWVAFAGVVGGEGLGEGVLGHLRVGGHGWGGWEVCLLVRWGFGNCYIF